MVSHDKDMVVSTVNLVSAENNDDYDRCHPQQQSNHFETPDHRTTPTGPGFRTPPCRSEDIRDVEYSGSSTESEGLGNARNLLASLRLVVDSSETTNSRLKLECEDAKSRLSEVLERTRVLEVELNYLKSENQSLKEERYNLLERNTVIEKEATRLDQQKSVSTEQQVKLEQDIERLQETNKELKHRAEENIAVMKATCVEADKELESLRQQVAQYPEKVQLLTDLVNQSASERDTTRKLLCETIERMAFIKNQASSVLSELTMKLDTTTKQLEEFQNTDKTVAKIESLEDEVKLLQQSLEYQRIEFEAQVASLTRQILQLERELCGPETKQANVSTADDSTMDLYAAYQALIREKNNLLAAVETRGQKSLKLEENVQKLSGEVDQYKADIKGLKESKTSLQKDLVVANEDREHLQGRISSLNSKLERLTTDLDEREKEYTSKMAKLREEARENDNEHANKFSKLRSELARYEKENEECRSKVLQLQNDQQVIVNSKQQIIDSKVKEIEELQSEMGQLSKKVQIAESKLEMWKQEQIIKDIERNRELSECKKSLEELRNREKSLQSGLSDFERQSGCGGSGPSGTDFLQWPFIQSLPSVSEAKELSLPSQMSPSTTTKTLEDARVVVRGSKTATSDKENVSPLIHCSTGSATLAKSLSSPAPTTNATAMTTSAKTVLSSSIHRAGVETRSTSANVFNTSSRSSGINLTGSSGDSVSNPKTYRVRKRGDDDKVSEGTAHTPKKCAKRAVGVTAQQQELRAALTILAPQRKESELG
ncbi:hypothetical protein BGZ94_003348 [Podila epigama]|nr:hypothetical protein BGZ94_003348 [Podila epigama]